MLVFYAVLLLLLAGGLTSLLLGPRQAALTAASLAACVAAVLGFGFSLFLLLEGVSLSGYLPLPLPLGHCLFRVDPLSVFFLLPVFLLVGIGGALLPSRILAYGERPGGSIAFGRHGFFFCLLAAGMVLTLIASDAVLFLVAWEVMSLAPFFLLGVRDRSNRERFAGWIYLVAAHLGALPLLFLFAAMSVEAGHTGFAALAAHGANVGWQQAGLLFVLGLIGFGVKIGLFPLHVWMPESYPEAPAHVAAVLSGAMVNLGVYGILRVIQMTGPPEVWWAYLLMSAGGASGILGVLFALAQPDIKRALAYSSAENMGVVCLALGAGLLALYQQSALACLLFFGGALLHLWNHSLFKSLAFLVAGAVHMSTGTTNINQLGGLQKRMPFAGACMGAASASLAGVPPWNGFTGEFLLYLGFVTGAFASAGGEGALFFWAGLFSLAGIAGLALLCFTRIYGLAFLGTPRSSLALHGCPAGPEQRAAMLLLAALCLIFSLAAPGIFLALKPALSSLLTGIGLPLPSLTLGTGNFWRIASYLARLSFGCAALMGITGLIVLYRRRLAKRRPAEGGLTWDCGYRFPSARMQYTGGGFAHLPAAFLRPLLRPALQPDTESGGAVGRDDLFPRSAKAEFTAPDWAAGIWQRLIQATVRLADAAKEIQQGVVNLYILYILVALLAALIWALGGAA